MDKNKVITYSLLAHINNNRTLAKGLLDLFIPIVKRGLSILNSEGIHSGKSIKEIKDKVDNLYTLDIPIPVLKRILEKIATEVNLNGIMRFNLYNDGAFAIKEFTFTEYEDVIERKKQEIEEVENLFSDFSKISNIKDAEYSSIFDFIDKNKLSISKYLGGQEIKNNQKNFLIEAQFVDYFKKIPEVYSIIRNIYLGSIISTYIEFKTETYNSDIELVFDTNFLIGLLDLNTPESSHTCSKLIDIAKGLGYKMTVLNLTIVETQNLLKARADNFESAYIQRRVNPEDIYNACDRRGLNKTDLERFADNLEDYLVGKGIYIIPNTDKYQNIAKFSKEYASLKNVRSSGFAALHDATAIYYIREKRKKKIYAFEEVKCWFVHNSNNSQIDATGDSSNGKHQSDFIKADDLLNILWLSNPGFAQQLSDGELSDFGLNALISSTLSDALPKASLIRELDFNISKYIKDNTLNEKDIIRVATRISNRELLEIEDLNKLEKESSKAFIKKIKEESEKQREIEDEKAKKFENIFRAFKEHGLQLKAEREDLESKRIEIEKNLEDAQNAIKSKSGESVLLEKELLNEKRKRLEFENQIREAKKEELITIELKKWRRKTWIEFIVISLILIIVMISIGYIGKWTIEGTKLAYTQMQNSIILSTLGSIGIFVFTGITINTLFHKYRNVTLP